MKTQVFAYKNVIGIKSDFKAEGLINDPTQVGQLGFILNMKDVEISQEAIDLLLKIKKSRDAIGDIMAWEAIHDNRPIICFAFLGGPLRMITKDNEGDRDYNPSLFSKHALIVKNEPDIKFIEIVDNLNKEI